MSILHWIFILLLYFLLIRPIIRKMSQDRFFPHMRRDPYQEEKFLRVLFIVAREVAHADGKGESAHELAMVVEMVRQVLGNRNLGADSIIKQYRQHANTQLRHEDVSQLSLRYRQIVFLCAINVAASDHVVTEAEMRALRRVGKKLEIPEIIIDQLLGRLQGGRQQSRSYQGSEVSAVDFAYKTLGLKSGASASEIKSAYRRLAMKHHPDRVPEKDKKAAEEKFKEIGDAYKILRDRN